MPDNSEGVNYEKDSITEQDSSSPSKNDERSSDLYDNVAKHIAGIGAVNPIVEWTKYAEHICVCWSKMKRKNLNKIPEWTAQYITPHTEGTDVIFYPFGGPDVTYPLHFFPCAHTHILVGLEPLGSFTDIQKNLKNVNYYQMLAKATDHFLQKGYFITSEMGQHLSRKNVQGGLSLILMQLAHLGFDITDIQTMYINIAGEIVHSNEGNLKCVKISFTKDSDIKHVYYIQANLMNTGSKLPQLIQFLKKFEYGTFIKSASYALFDDRFSEIRSLILQDSHFVLQDDTGMPFRFLKSGTGEVHLFGNYRGPNLKVFKAYFQPDLKRSYETSKLVSIPVWMGYGYNVHNPNLQLFCSKHKDILEKIGKLREELKNQKCHCDKKD